MLALLIWRLFVVSLGWSIARAQQDGGSGSLTGEVPEFPGEWISGIPLPCGEGCIIPANTYYVCHLNTTLWDGQMASQEQCNEYLCEPESYDHLLACLNCIIANGNERPIGYHTNTALTAPVTDDPFARFGPPVGGYINRTQADGWLANVTERCSSIGRALDGVTTTLTAAPTTTGPYQTAWISGQTILLPTWTGLTEYSELFFPSVTPVWGDALVTSIPGISSSRRSQPASSSTPTSPATSNAASSTASAPAEATSSPNAGAPRVQMPLYYWCLLPLGLWWI